MSYMLRAIRRSIRSLAANISPRSTPPHAIKRAFHKDYLPARHDQSALLRDGRKIGFAEWGATSGPPIFMFHGSPGSRYDGVEYHDLGVKYGFRIICPDRPGHGLSTNKPGRKLVEYPDDISQLAKHLGLERFRVLGQSGGGPGVIACAAVLPPSELISGTVVAGMGHPNQINVREAGFYTVFALFWYRYFPGLLRWYMNTFELEKIRDDQRCQKSLDYTYTWLPEPDRTFMQKADQNVVRASLQAAFAQGPDGVIEDGHTFNGPWGFELEQARGRIRLFYGEKDVRTPLCFGRYYKRHLVNADVSLKEFENVGHFNMDEKYEEIVKEVFRDDLSVVVSGDDGEGRS